jgi:hypothetical protein
MSLAYMGSILKSYLLKEGIRQVKLSKFFQRHAAQAQVK